MDVETTFRRRVPAANFFPLGDSNCITSKNCAKETKTKQNQISHGSNSFNKVLIDLRNKKFPVNFSRFSLAKMNEFPDFLHVKN